jgi:hypothetical protein
MAKSDLDILFLPLNAALPRTQLDGMVESRLSPDHPVVGIDRCHRRIDRCVPDATSSVRLLDFSQDAIDNLKVRAYVPRLREHGARERTWVMR